MGLSLDQRTLIFAFLVEKGLQICWTPDKDIQSHFIEVVFSHQGKSDGGPIRAHRLYQHLGIAQVFYRTLEGIESQRGCNGKHIVRPSLQ